MGIIFGFFVFAIVLLYPCSVGWMAVPVALGRQTWWVRFVALLGFSIGHGMIIGAFATGNWSSISSILFAMLFLVGGSLSSPGFLRTTFFVFAAILSTPMWQQIWAMEVEWFARGLVVVALLCGGLSFWRILGYRLIRFSPLYDDERLAVGSGYGVDEWFGILKQHSPECDRESVVASIRSRGVDEYWTDLIADMYQQLNGRLPLPSKVGDQAETVVSASDPWAERWLSDLPQRFRFSIVQIMIWSFCAAIMMGIARIISDYFPTMDDYRYGPSLIVLVWASTILSGVAALAPSPRGRVILFCIAFFLILLYLSSRVGLMFAPPGAPVFFSQLAAVLLVIEMFAGFCLLRTQGYRLVRVRSQP